MLYIFPSIILAVVFFYAFWPFKCFLYELRIYFLKILFKFIYPIGPTKVDFRLVIFSGIMSSLTRAFLSFTIIMCTLSCQECTEANDRMDCSRTHLFGYLVQVVPYVLRTIQSFNVVYYKKQYWPHMANGFRFLFSSTTVTMSYLYAAKYTTSIYYYISFAIATYLYNIFWDYNVSWNVLQRNAKFFMIRNKISYPQWFYYYAIISNLFLRAGWTLKFIFTNSSADTVFTSMTLIEVYRRIQFILLRVENEFYNNPEKYRKFIPVPEISEDTTSNEAEIDINHENRA